MPENPVSVDYRSRQGLIEIAKLPGINEALLKIRRLTANEEPMGLDPVSSILNIRKNDIIEALKTTLNPSEQLQPADSNPQPAISFLEGNSEDVPTATSALSYLLTRIEDNNRLLSEKCTYDYSHVEAETQNLYLAAAMVINKHLEQIYGFGKEEQEVDILGQVPENRVFEIVQVLRDQANQLRSDKNKVLLYTNTLIDLIDPQLPAGTLNDMVSGINLSYGISNHETVQEYQIKLPNPKSLGIANKVLNINLGIYPNSNEKSSTLTEKLIYQIAVLPDYGVYSTSVHEKITPKTETASDKDIVPPTTLLKKHTFHTLISSQPASQFKVKPPISAGSQTNNTDKNDYPNLPQEPHPDNFPTIGIELPTIEELQRNLELQPTSEKDFQPSFTLVDDEDKTKPTKVVDTQPAKIKNL
jgi:hypothetical protein